MYLNRDELMLLSRGGRAPAASRAGPRYRDWLEPHEREGLRVIRARSRRSPRGPLVPRLRRVLRGGGRAEHEPARSPSIRGYAEHERYVEMEFAVGFGVEDEHWL